MWANVGDLKKDEKEGEVGHIGWVVYRMGDLNLSHTMTSNSIVVHTEHDVKHQLLIISLLLSTTPRMEV